MTEIVREKAAGAGAETAPIPPVFEGLLALGVTGKEIAAALRVSTASVSKWRNGRAVVPDDLRVFLTLMLGDQISRAAEYHDDAPSDVSSEEAMSLDTARRALGRQERLNGGLPAMAVRDGARQYRLWWNAVRNASYLKPDDLMRGLGAELAQGIR